MNEHLYNKEEYARRITHGEIDTDAYYASPAEVEVKKFNIQKPLFYSLFCSNSSIIFRKSN